MSNLDEPKVPQFFEVKWPTDKQVIRSNGVTDFFRDFYAMSVQRPYQQPPGFHFIKVLVNPICINSNSSQPKCLIVCSSHWLVQNPLHNALLRVRAKQSVRDRSSIGSWSPLHDLMDCISVVYQMMFQNIEIFVRQQLLVLQAVVSHCLLRLTENEADHYSRNSMAVTILGRANFSISTSLKIKQQ